MTSARFPPFATASAADSYLEELAADGGAAAASWSRTTGYASHFRAFRVFCDAARLEWRPSHDRAANDRLLVLFVLHCLKRRSPSSPGLGLPS